MSPLFQPIEINKKPAQDLNILLVKNPVSTHFIRIEGACFEEHGIHNGDILVVDKSRINYKHEWYVIIIENEFTLLPRYKHPQKDCEYWGAVTYIIKKV